MIKYQELKMVIPLLANAPELKKDQGILFDNDSH
jgi:hypothetical protein